jgi:hypothetical protein
MKKIIVLLVLLFPGTVMIAQDKKDVFDDISQAFLTNDSQRIGNNLAQSIDISILTNDGTFGKPQATVLIKDFLQSNNVSSFTIKHKGSSNDLTQYAVCNMTSGQINWRVYILVNKELKIIQLQIEKE